MYEDFKWLPVGKSGDDAVMVDRDEWEDLITLNWRRHFSTGAPEGLIVHVDSSGGQYRSRTLGQHLLKSRARGKIVMHRNGDRQDFRMANLEAIERGMHWVYGLEGDPNENLSEYVRQQHKGRVISGATARITATIRQKAALKGRMAGVRPLPNDSGTPRHGVRMMISGKQRSFGSYATQGEAGRVYDWLLVQLGLAPVNFPRETPRPPASTDDANKYLVMLGLSVPPVFSWPREEEGVAV